MRMTMTASNDPHDVDRSMFSEIVIAIGPNTALTLRGTFSLATARPLIDRFWQEHGFDTTLQKLTARLQESTADLRTAMQAAAGN